MARGRPPKPLAVRLNEGNVSHRPLNLWEASVPVNAPPCPDALDGAARAEWDRIMPILTAARMISELDLATAAGYCQAFGDWADNLRLVKKHGVFARQPSGGIAPTAFYRATIEASMRMLKFAQDLGLNAGHRARIRPNNKTESEPGAAIAAIIARKG